MIFCKHGGDIPFIIPHKIIYFQPILPYLTFHIKVCYNGYIVSSFEIRDGGRVAGRARVARLKGHCARIPFRYLARDYGDMPLLRARYTHPCDKPAGYRTRAYSSVDPQPTIYSSAWCSIE